MSEIQQLEKYEAWIAKLESNIEDMKRQRRAFYGIFFGAVVLSAIGFFWGVWLGAATFFTGIMICTAGLYITMMRETEYREELKQTRADVTRMKAE
jgi:hypothetical protein